MTARLIEPGDPTWASMLRDAAHDCYHLPAYTELSARQERGRACALYVERDSVRVLLPLIVRPIDGGDFDATSAYGYPGPIVAGDDDPAVLRDALAEGTETLAAEGLVSLFVRMHPILNPRPPEGIGTLVRHADTITIDLSLPSTALWQQMRSDHRIQIRHALKAGYGAEIDQTWAHLETFKRLYRDTMRRVAAQPFYLFDDAYFEDLRSALGDRLWLAVVAIDGEVAAAQLLTETGGIVQDHLAASDVRFARLALSKLLINHIREWAQQRGNRWFHLGGGRGASRDSLYEFKAAFSEGRSPFHTLRVVLRDDRYRELAGQELSPREPLEAGGYFPSYRASAAPVTPSPDAGIPDAGPLQGAA
jgi:hypothetical protein